MVALGSRRQERMLFWEAGRYFLASPHPWAKTMYSLYYWAADKTAYESRFVTGPEKCPQRRRCGHFSYLPCPGHGRFDAEGEQAGKPQEAEEQQGQPEEPQEQEARQVEATPDYKELLER